METNQFISFLEYIQKHPHVIDKVIKRLEAIPENIRLNYRIDEIEFGESKPFIAFCFNDQMWVCEQVDLKGDY